MYLFKPLAALLFALSFTVLPVWSAWGQSGSTKKSTTDGTNSTWYDTTRNQVLDSNSTTTTESSTQGTGSQGNPGETPTPGKPGNCKKNSQGQCNPDSPSQ
jgi:hypothetical protein